MRFLRAAFRRIASIRQAPAVHPHGLTFQAELVSAAPLPDGRYDAIARLTKGAIPACDWGAASYSTLSPYERHGHQFWLRAVPDSPVGHASVSGLEHRAPAGFTLTTAGKSGDWLTIGRLTLLSPMADTGDRFDPILNCPPGWRPAPAWLSALREAAYQGSRRGRGVGSER